MEWQPIETAPKEDGTWILGWQNRKELQDQISVWCWTEGVDYACWVNAVDNNELWEQPTHWMPLPEPPQK